jgi:hypothetical protein
LVQSGDFLLAQGTGKYRESADESGKDIAHGGHRIEARMTEANVATQPWTRIPFFQGWRSRKFRTPNPKHRLQI